MKRLVAAALIAPTLATIPLAAGHADAAYCWAPYNCVSTYNACKYVCNYIPHTNTGVARMVEVTAE